MVLIIAACLLWLMSNTFTFTFTFMHLADAFIQSDLQLHSGYTFSLVRVFPGNRTHNLLRCWRNALPLSHSGIQHYPITALRPMTCLGYIWSDQNSYFWIVDSGLGIFIYLNDWSLIEQQIEIWTIMVKASSCRGLAMLREQHPFLARLMHKQTYLTFVNYYRNYYIINYYIDHRLPDCRQWHAMYTAFKFITNRLILHKVHKIKLHVHTVIYMIISPTCSTSASREQHNKASRYIL